MVAEHAAAEQHCMRCGRLLGDPATPPCPSCEPKATTFRGAPVKASLVRVDARRASSVVRL